MGENRIMGNNDIIISSEKGTILNYFGSANTYDPFTNQTKLQTVKDLDFNIPETVPFETAEFVAVSTGLLATSMSFLNYCEFSILDKTTGQKITDLKNYIGEIGNSAFYPAENQIFWFNKDGLKGTFYLHKSHAGRILHITSGMFTTTAITSSVLNDMFERTIGVPKYIQDINSRLDEQDKMINKYKIAIEQIASDKSSFSTTCKNIKRILILYIDAQQELHLSGYAMQEIKVKIGNQYFYNQILQGGGMHSIETERSGAGSITYTYINTKHFLRNIFFYTGNSNYVEVKWHTNTNAYVIGYIAE